MRIRKSFYVLLSLLFISASPSSIVYTEEGAPEHYPRSDKPGKDFRQIPRYPGSVRMQTLDQRGSSCSYTIYYLSKDDFPKIQEFFSSRLSKLGWQTQRKEDYKDDEDRVIGGFTEFSQGTLKLYVCVEEVPPAIFLEKVKASRIWVTLMESRPPWQLKDEEVFSASPPGDEESQVGLLPEVEGVPPPTAQQPGFEKIPGWETSISPQRRWQISHPRNWQVGPIGATEEGVIVEKGGLTPPGQLTRNPQVVVFGSEASSQWFVRSRQMVVSKWSARQAVEQLLMPAIQASVPDLKVEKTESESAEEATYLLACTFQNEPMVVRYACKMDYLWDPTMSSSSVWLTPDLSALGGWYSFMFITSYSASRREFSMYEPTAMAIINSFKPDVGRWFQEAFGMIINGMITRMEMVQGTSRRIAAMEINQRLSEMQSTARIGERWIDALGGVEDVASTSGEHYKVPFGYDRYFRDVTGQIIGLAHSDQDPGPGWEELRRSGSPFEQ